MGLKLQGYTQVQWTSDMDGKDICAQRSINKCIIISIHFRSHITRYIYQRIDESETIEFHFKAQDNMNICISTVQCSLRRRFQKCSVSIYASTYDRLLDLAASSSASSSTTFRFLSQQNENKTTIQKKRNIGISAHIDR